MFIQHELFIIGSFHKFHKPL